MAVSAPLYPLGAFGPGVSLLVALAIGVGFGFILERAGLGDARKLTGQFYLRDMTVLKVMLTAILTALVGAEFLAQAGVLELRFVLVPPTYLLPQLIGGLLFGVGFVAGGYCPGTSCVAASTGRVDGVVVFAGMLAGMLAFAELYPLLDSLYAAGPSRQATLSELTGLSRPAIAAAVAALGIITLAVAECWDKSKLHAHAGRPSDDGASAAA
jgi:uncharacterized membrane protein YedE/YeeE